MARTFSVAESVVTSDHAIEGRHGTVPLRRYRPADGTGDASALLVWNHGGAFAWGGLEQLEAHAVAASVAAAGHEVVSVDYRKSPTFSWFRTPRRPTGRPGHVFPVPMDDVTDAFLAVAGSTDRDVVLGGASAGACLAAAAALRLRDDPGRRPSRLVLAYGTFHASLPPIGAELHERTRGRHGITRFRPPMVERMNRNYAGSAEGSLVFPGGSDLRDLPPTTLIDADRDTLRASGAAFAAELAAAEVEVEYSVVPDAPHGFLNRPGTALFDRGIEHILRALRHHPTAAADPTVQA